VVSRGRPVDPSDQVCSGDDPPYACGGTGIDPGTIPSLPSGFIGELRCIEADAAGAPLSGNHLTGDASIVSQTTLDVSRYSAIGLAGFDSNDGDGSLLLGSEYASCPAHWRLNHAADGATVPGAGPGSAVHTDLTIVPCSANIDAQLPTVVAVQFVTTTDHGLTLSAATTVDCWGSFRLSDVNPILEVDALASDSLQTVVRPATVTESAILMMAEEVRAVGGASASAAANAHSEGTATSLNAITIPAVVAP
jgi:hypothetical protein